MRIAAACGVIMVSLALILYLAAGGRGGGGVGGGGGAADPNSSSPSELTDDQVQYVLEAFHLPRDLDVDALAVLLLSDSTNASLVARIRIGRGEMDRVAESSTFPGATTARFREYRLSLPDHYDVPWWDAIPIAQNDRLYYWNISEAGRSGYLAEVLRSTVAGADLYLARGSRHANLSPQLVAVMRGARKQTSNRFGIPSNIRLYERTQGRF